MAGEKEAYSYKNHVQNLSGAKLNIVENPHFYKRILPYQSPLHDSASDFLKSTENNNNPSLTDDLFSGKAQVSKDEIGLLLGEIRGREGLKMDNLQRIYDDLFRIDKWRSEVPFPEYLMTGNTWTDLNKMELKLREQIRAELNISAKDLVFPAKDLRRSLLEFKVQDQKSQMMKDLEVGSLDEMIEPGGSYKETGDPNEMQPRNEKEMVKPIFNKYIP